MDEEPFRAHHDQPNDRPTTCQRLSFSQNTPLTVDEEAPEKRGHIFSPGTLQQSVYAGFTAPPAVSLEKKKKKKRVIKGTKRPGESASQPALKVIQGHNTVSPCADGFIRNHKAGKPILPPQMLHVAGVPMQSLHESVLTRERLLLEEEDPNYLVFMVQVPEDVD